MKLPLYLNSISSIGILSLLSAPLTTVKNTFAASLPGLNVSVLFNSIVVLALRYAAIATIILSKSTTLACPTSGYMLLPTVPTPSVR